MSQDPSSIRLPELPIFKKYSLALRQEFARAAEILALLERTTARVQAQVQKTEREISRLEEAEEARLLARRRSEELLAAQAEADEVADEEVEEEPEEEEYEEPSARPKRRKPKAKARPKPKSKPKRKPARKRTRPKVITVPSDTARRKKKAPAKKSPASRKKKSPARKRARR